MMKMIALSKFYTPGLMENIKIIYLHHGKCQMHKNRKLLVQQLNNVKIMD